MATKTKAVTTTATPWGAAHRVEKLTLPQRAGEKRFASVVELLVTEQGERLVRFAYSTGGAVRRGPVTLRVRDLERLRAALAEHPGLAEALRPRGRSLDGGQSPIPCGVDERREDQCTVRRAEKRVDGVLGMGH